MAYAERLARTWRARFKKPDGTWASKSGFDTKEAALHWAEEQEAEVRRRTWISPEDSEVAFGDFAQEWLAQARLAETTQAKYHSYLDTYLLPQWEDWPPISIFNSHLEIQAWVNELHEELAEPSVSSIFALFSTMLNVAVRARRIPANPCNGVRVSSGDYEADRQVGHPGAGAAGGHAATRELWTCGVRAGAHGRLHRGALVGTGGTGAP